MTLQNKFKAVFSFIGIYLGVLFLVFRFFLGSLDYFVTYGLALLVILILLLRVGKTFEMTFFRFGNLKIRYFFIALGIGMGMNVLTNLVMEHLPREVLTNQAAIEEAASQADPIFLFITIVILGPIVEELVFRSLWVQNVFRDQAWVGLLISSILFSLAHDGITLTSFTTYFLMGVSFSLIYMATKSLEAAIFWHIFNNFLAFSALMGWLKI